MADAWDLISTPAQPSAGPAASGWDAISAPVADAPVSGVTQGKTAPLRIQMGNPQAPAPAAQPPPDASVWGMAKDFVGSIPGGILTGLSNAASAGGQAAQIEMGQPVDAPDAAGTKAAIEQNVTGQLPQPQGRAGQFGATIGEFLGNPASYIAPGSIPAKIGMAVLGGIGSETGGQLAEGTPYEGAARFAGGAIGAGAAAKAFQPGQVSAAIGPKPAMAAPSVPALKAAASAGYEAPEVGAVTMAAPAVASKVDSLVASLGQDIDPILAPKVFGLLEKATKAPADSVVTVPNLRSLRRMLGKVALLPDPTEREAAQKAMAHVDGILEKIGPSDVLSGNPASASQTIKTANANYSSAKTAERLDKRINKAELSAEASHSGLNIGNRLRQQAVAILTNDAARRGLKPDEITKLEELARGTPTRNTIRWFSNVFGGGGGLGAVVAGEVGQHTFGPIGWALAPVGLALRSIENVLTVRAANQISEVIRSRSPLGQAINNAAQDWLKARDALTSGPNSAKFAAFSLASRNLSNNLASIGVRVHPTQLLKSVQGPMDSSADEKQQ